jgi:hypothetical protein
LHCKSRKNHSEMLWRIINVELWLGAFMDCEIPKDACDILDDVLEKASCRLARPGLLWSQDN